MVKPEIASATFTPGQPGGAPLWALLLVALAVLTPGIIQLSRRSGSVIEDSPAFVRALEEWFPLLATGGDMTPRAVKRFINRVRYFAMMEGRFRPALRWWERLALFFRSKTPAAEEPSRTRTGDDLLVALATVHERHPEWFAGDVQDFRSAAAASALPRREEIANVAGATFEQFKRLIAGVEVR